MGGFFVRCLPDRHIVFCIVTSAHVADDERGVTPRGYFGPATDPERHVQWHRRDDDPPNVVFVCVNVRAFEGLTEAHPSVLVWQTKKCLVTTKLVSKSRTTSRCFGQTTSKCFIYEKRRFKRWMMDFFTSYGNVERYPLYNERNRTGGAGVYYHVCSPRSALLSSLTEIVQYDYVGAVCLRARRGPNSFFRSVIRWTTSGLL